MKNLSFTDFIKSYGEKHPPELLFDENSDINEWREKLLRALESLRSPLPERINPEVKILESNTEDTHTRHLLEIPVSEFSTLPAYLLIPHGIKDGEKRPGIIASHGHIGGGAAAICGAGKIDPRQSYALSAVQSGFVVLAPAWWGWPERDGHIEFIGDRRDRCNVIQFTAATYGINVLDLHIQDTQAALDILCSRPEVDPEKIACMGNSYGGRTTMWFSIFDERIKAVVATGSMNTFRERSLKLASCAIQSLPGVLKYCDIAELFCLIAPRALQLQAGKLDKLITPEDRDMIAAKVKSAYQKSSCPDKYEYILHEDGHFLLWEYAEPFLKKHLGF